MSVAGIARSNGSGPRAAGNTIVNVGPVQPGKVTSIVTAAARNQDALGIGHIITVARELDPAKIEALTNDTIAKLRAAGLPADFTHSVIDAREWLDRPGELPPPELVVALRADAAAHGPIAGVFAGMDRYVLSTARLGEALEEAGALQSGRSLSSAGLAAVLDKARFRQLMDEIDPDGAHFFHPRWQRVACDDLTPENLRALFDRSSEREFFVVPVRGSAAFGVYRVELDAPELEATLAQARAQNHEYRATKSSVFRGTAEFLVVERVRGREGSIEMVAANGEFIPLQLHMKYDQGDDRDPDGLFERTYIAQGTTAHGAADDSRVRLIEEKTILMLQQLRDRGFPIDNMVLHIEYRVEESTGKVYVLEINARPGGSVVPKVVETVSDGQINLYGLVLYTALRHPIPTFDFTWRMAGDVTLYAEPKRNMTFDAVSKWRFDGFWLQDPVIGDNARYAGDWSDEQVLSEVSQVLSRVSREQARRMLMSAVALGYPAQDADRIVAAFDRDPSFRGLQARLMQIEQWHKQGEEFPGLALASIYIGNGMAVVDEGVPRDIGEAHLIAMMSLLRHAMIGPVIPVCPARTTATNTHLNADVHTT